MDGNCLEQTEKVWIIIYFENIDCQATKGFLTCMSYRSICAVPKPAGLGEGGEGGVGGGAR